jgi:acyl-CoA synthetase (AMP-forming)/AMP-acid ligase II
VLLGVGEVPRTSSGKISRSACRTWYAAREAAS